MGTDASVGHRHREGEMRCTPRQTGLSALLALGLLLPMNLHAQEQTCTQTCGAYQLAFGGSGADRFNAVQELDDGGLILAGLGRSWAGGTQALLVRVNSCGTVLWARTYGGTGRQEFLSVEVTPEGGYLAAGINTATDPAGDQWVIKTDADGVVVWSYVHDGDPPLEVDGHTIQEYATHAVPTSDGGAIMVGESFAYGPGSPRFDATLVVKIAADGTRQWSQVYGSPDGEMSPQEVREVKNAAGDWDGYAVVAGCEGFGVGARLHNKLDDAWLMRLGPDGTHRWSVCYGSDGDDDPTGMFQKPDGHFLIAGNTQNFGAVLDDVFVAEMDGEGSLVWFKRYGGADAEGATALAPKGSGAVISARTRSWGAGLRDMLAMNVDGQGNVLSAHAYGGTGDDVNMGMAVTAGGGLALVGSMDTLSASGVDGWLVRAMPDGVSGCHEVEVPITGVDVTPEKTVFTPVVMEAGQQRPYDVPQASIDLTATSTTLCPCSQWMEHCTTEADCTNQPPGSCNADQTGAWSCRSGSCAWECTTALPDAGPASEDGSMADAGSTEDAGSQEDASGGVDASVSSSNGSSSSEPISSSTSAASGSDLVDAGSMRSEGKSGSNVVESGCTCRGSGESQGAILLLALFAMVRIRRIASSAH